MEMEQITRKPSLRTERYFDICTPYSGQMFKDVKRFQMIVSLSEVKNETN